MIEITIKSNLKGKEKEMDNKLTKLNNAIHNAGFILQKAVQDDIASYPSVDTGWFKANIHTDVSVPYQSIVYTQVKYSKYLEYGTSAHFISPKTKKALRWKGGKNWFFSKGHMVSGIKPRQHFRRTAMKMKPVLIDYVNKSIQ